MKGEIIRGFLFLVLMTVLMVLALGITLMIPVEGFQILSSVFGR